MQSNANRYRWNSGQVLVGQETGGGTWVRAGGEDLAQFVRVSFFLLVCNLNLIDCKEFSRIGREDGFSRFLQVNNW